MQNNEWILSPCGKELIHRYCGGSAWNSNDSYLNSDIKLWQCYKCKEEVPNYLILQWKLLNGK